MTKRSHTTTGNSLLSHKGRLAAHDFVSRRCPVCGKRMYMGSSDRRERLTIDHVTPHAAGGADSLGNLVPMCGSCNFSKSDRELVEWLGDRLPAVKATRAKTQRGILDAANDKAAELTQLAADVKTALSAQGITK